MFESWEVGASSSQSHRSLRTVFLPCLASFTSEHIGCSSLAKIDHGPEMGSGSLHPPLEMLRAGICLHYSFEACRVKQGTAHDY